MLVSTYIGQFPQLVPHLEKTVVDISVENRSVTVIFTVMAGP